MRMPTPSRATRRRHRAAPRWRRGRGRWRFVERSISGGGRGRGRSECALLAGGHFTDQLRFEMRGLHEMESLMGAGAHFRRDVEDWAQRVEAEKKAGNDSVEAARGRGCVRRGARRRRPPDGCGSWETSQRSRPRRRSWVVGVTMG